MRLSLLAAFSIVAHFASPARACEPQDVPVYVGATDDGFVFVSRQSVVRVRADGEVLGRWSEPGLAFALFPDRQTLLVVTDEGESVLDCLPRRLRMRVLDTAGRGRGRTVGTFPRGGVDASTVVGIDPDGEALRVQAQVFRNRGDDERTESVRITREGRLVPTSDALPTPPAAAESRLRVVQGTPREDGRTSMQITSEGGRQVRVDLVRMPETWALHGDRHLALVTYERINDWGTAFEARLDVVDLETGVVVTPYGEQSGVTAVEGRIAFRCERVVSDRSALNVRSRPAPGAPVSASLPDGTVVVEEERRGSWARLREPVAGWVWAASLVQRCREVTR
ncbi:MAG: SH3 domain-containing protein [Sandaracinus sp.]|nr:SH3 domain-containing protein [Sandaracinus sp.]MCB9621885.1 SH3 domain-containing protein [Sandaracinus sp.]